VHVPNLTRRTQVLLDERRYQRLRSRAAAQGCSIGALVRDAIDQALASDQDTGVSRSETFLSAPPLPVGEPDDLSAEMEHTLARDE